MSVVVVLFVFFFFFFNDTATTEIYTLSLHDALPIYLQAAHQLVCCSHSGYTARGHRLRFCKYSIRVENSLRVKKSRSEEHTSELQSRQYLVCRLLLEKKKKKKYKNKKQIISLTQSSL